jgi:hypothetical protein
MSPVPIINLLEEEPKQIPIIDLTASEQETPKQEAPKQAIPIIDLSAPELQEPIQQVSPQQPTPIIDITPDEPNKRLLLDMINSPRKIEYGNVVGGEFIPRQPNLNETQELGILSTEKPNIGDILNIPSPSNMEIKVAYTPTDAKQLAADALVAPAVKTVGWLMQGVASWFSPQSIAGSAATNILAQMPGSTSAQTGIAPTPFGEVAKESIKGKEFYGAANVFKQAPMLADINKAPEEVKQALNYLDSNPVLRMMAGASPIGLLMGGKHLQEHGWPAFNVPKTPEKMDGFISDMAKPFYMPEDGSMGEVAKAAFGMPLFAPLKLGAIAIEGYNKMAGMLSKEWIPKEKYSTSDVAGLMTDLVIGLSVGQVAKKVVGFGGPIAGSVLAKTPMGEKVIDITKKGLDRFNTLSKDFRTAKEAKGMPIDPEAIKLEAATQMYNEAKGTTSIVDLLYARGVAQDAPRQYFKTVRSIEKNIEDKWIPQEARKYLPKPGLTLFPESKYEKLFPGTKPIAQSARLIVDKAKKVLESKYPTIFKPLSHDLGWQNIIRSKEIDHIEDVKFAVDLQRKFPHPNDREQLSLIVDDIAYDMKNGKYSNFLEAVNEYPDKLTPNQQWAVAEALRRGDAIYKNEVKDGVMFLGKESQPYLMHFFNSKDFENTARFRTIAIPLAAKHGSTKLRQLDIPLREIAENNELTSLAKPELDLAKLIMIRSTRSLRSRIAAEGVPYIMENYGRRIREATFLSPLERKSMEELKVVRSTILQRSKELKQMVKEEAKTAYKQELQIKKGVLDAILQIDPLEQFNLGKISRMYDDLKNGRIITAYRGVVKEAKYSVNKSNIKEYQKEMKYRSGLVRQFYKEFTNRLDRMKTYGLVRDEYKEDFKALEREASKVKEQMKKAPPSRLPYPANPKFFQEFDDANQYVAYHSDLVSRISGLKKGEFFLPKSVAGEVNRLETQAGDVLKEIHKMLREEHPVSQKLLDVYDSFLDIWRTSVYTIWPSSYVRNSFGMVDMTYKRIGKKTFALDTWRHAEDVRKGAPHISPYGVHTNLENEFKAGGMFFDIREKVGSPDAKAWWLAAGKFEKGRNKIANITRDLGSMIAEMDNKGRRVIALDALDKGMSLPQAIKEGKDAQINYAFNPYIKKNLGRIQMFYSYFYRNWQLQLRNFWKVPERQMIQLKAAMLTRQKETQEHVPPWKLNTMWYDLHDGTMVPKLGLNMEDIFETIASGGRNFSRMSPVLRMGGELIFNKNLGTGGNLWDRNTGRGYVNKGWANAPDWMKKTFDIQVGSRGGVSTGSPIMFEAAQVLGPGRILSTIKNMNDPKRSELQNVRYFFTLIDTQQVDLTNREKRPLKERNSRPLKERPLKR